VEEQGFRVARLELGTQTGTHIDAPAHFSSDGATLESLPVNQLMGAYFLVDLPDCCNLESIRKLSASYSQEPILFLRANSCGISRLPVGALNALIELPPEVWVLAGMIEVVNAPSLEFHRIVALAGKFLIEDLQEAAAALVPRRGEIFALPLRLIGTSGAPCRVVVREAT
jgi:arylformamidase